VLTNGTTIRPRLADRLAALAAAAPYSLEIRVSLDDVDRERNDRVRGTGAWARAVEALRLLDARGLLPIVTATEILAGEAPAGRSLYERFGEFLRSLGIEKPRLKVLPVFPAGRLGGRSVARLTEEMLEGFERGQLQCADARVIAAGGVYACPILAGLDGARLGTGRLADAFRPASLYHPACVTCYESGMSCRNS
jgi:MoaA/NifB/PqqE/SkfB family radical SAM enzyme